MRNKTFLFGSATAAHQIEGGNTNCDWHKWEQIPGHIKDGSTAEIACDSWNKWQEDIKLLKEMGQNAYRFSIEWARIEPRKGEFDDKAIRHYRNILLELRKAGIASMVTLFHFTLPLWLAREGGFESSSSAKYFARYAERVANDLSDVVDHWVTLNEPNVYAYMGYVRGEWCPGRKSVFCALRVLSNLISAHTKASLVLHRYSSSVGIVINVSAFRAKNYLPLSHAIAWCVRMINHGVLFALLHKRVDFWGINYYFIEHFGIGFNIYHKQYPISDYGWKIYQNGLYEVIAECSRWKKPIYITENGVADNRDVVRRTFLKEAFFSLERAITEGFPIRGYFHWSLLDNLEWNQGYKMKFGLCTRDRKMRKSASVYSELIHGYSTKFSSSD